MIRARFDQCDLSTNTQKCLQRLRCASCHCLEFSVRSSCVFEYVRVGQENGNHRVFATRTTAFNYDPFQLSPEPLAQWLLQQKHQEATASRRQQPSVPPRNLLRQTRNYHKNRYCPFACEQSLYSLGNILSGSCSTLETMLFFWRRNEARTLERYVHGCSENIEVQMQMVSLLLYSYNRIDVISCQTGRIPAPNVSF